MEYEYQCHALGDDVNPGDIVLVDGEFHEVTSQGDDTGDTVFYSTVNLDGGDDDVMLDPTSEYMVYGR